MKKSDYCKNLISGLVAQYQEKSLIAYTIRDDLPEGSSGLEPEEVSNLIYSSIMFLADARAKSLGFPGSALIYRITKPMNRFEFALATKNEPDNLPLVLPFVAAACDHYLANEPVLVKTFEQAMKKIQPDFSLDRMNKIVDIDSIIPKSMMS